MTLLDVQHVKKESIKHVSNQVEAHRNIHLRLIKVTMLQSCIGESGQGKNQPCLISLAMLDKPTAGCVCIYRRRIMVVWT